MIERIYVHNYRCFENFTLDLKGKPSALVIGKNGSGKSTLRHAFGVLRDIARGPNRAKDWIDLSDFTQGRTDVPMSFEVNLILSGHQYHYAVSFEKSEHRREVHIEAERLTADGQAVFTRELGEVTLPNGSSFAIDWNIAFLPLLGQTPGDGHVGRVRTYLSELVLIAPTPTLMGGFAEDESAELSIGAENFVAWLGWLLALNPSLYVGITKYLTHVLPDLASFSFLPRGERGKSLQVKFKTPDRNGMQLLVDFGRLSDGEKCFFLSAAVLAFSQSEVPVFCFWDEPDNHLSLPEVGHFVMALRKMVHTGGQFVATSHHPEAIRRFSDENTLVFTRNSHLEPTRVRTLSEIEHKGDLINAILLGEVIA
jgi:predicted ATPase